jgi:hypothetical protein
VPVPVPGAAKQQAPGGQGQGQANWPPAQPAAESQDNAALLEKMMMNLRRASENFGRMEEGQGLVGAAGEQGRGAAPAQP